MVWPRRGAWCGRSWQFSRPPACDGVTVLVPFASPGMASPRPFAVRLATPGAACRKKFVNGRVAYVLIARLDRARRGDAFR
jgi:hypothetical protein